MFIAFHKKLDRGEKGFTLIELMVVVLIIAILIAIAIPTFLGARKRAQDKQAQSNLRNGLTAEKTYYVDSQAYTNSGALLNEIETSLVFNAVAPGDDASARQVAVEFPTDAVTVNYVILRSVSKSGKTFCIQDVMTGTGDGGKGPGTYYAASAATDGTDHVCVGETWNNSW